MGDQTETTTESIHPSAAMKPFLAVAADVRFFLLSVFTFGATPALLDFLFEIGPPWPQSSAVAAFTSLLMWIVLFYSYSEWDSLSEARLRYRVRLFAKGAFACMILYLLMTVAFVYEAPDFKHREAGGWWLQPAIRQAQNAYPERSIAELFKGKEYDPMEIWTPWTVTVNRGLFLLCWMGLFGLLAMLISAFVLLQHQRERSLGHANAVEPRGTLGG